MRYNFSDRQNYVYIEYREKKGKLQKMKRSPDERLTQIHGSLTETFQ